MNRKRTAAFTLIELLVVIAIIAVLITVAFPVFSSIQNQAKKTAAKNDVTQIVTAVNAFYTEYGKYPVSGSPADDAFFGASTDTAPSGASRIARNDVLCDVLRNNTANTNNAGTVTALNPRGIVFLDLKAVANNSSPRGGVIPNGATSGRIGVFYDPWGSEYRILIDTTYNNNLTNPYLDTAPPGGATLTTGVIAWSLGKNGVLGGGTAATGFDKETGALNNYSSSGDVISWQ